MPVDELPVPPTFSAIEAWAGVDRVVSAASQDMATWQLPDSQKAALISCGIPLIEGLVEKVSFHDKASFHAGPTMYQLAQASDPRRTYGAVVGTGQVVQVYGSNGSTRFVNSTINHWLCSLHLVGTWLTTSLALEHWDEDEEAEEAALAELADLLKRITVLDPAAYGTVGDHETHHWPAVLDRWLY
jgi:hypothetical protein